MTHILSIVYSLFQYIPIISRFLGLHCVPHVPCGGSPTPAIPVLKSLSRRAGTQRALSKLGPDLGAAPERRVPVDFQT